MLSFESFGISNTFRCWLVAFSLRLNSDLHTAPQRPISRWTFHLKMNFFTVKITEKQLVDLTKIILSFYKIKIKKQLNFTSQLATYTYARILIIHVCTLIQGLQRRPKTPQIKQIYRCVVLYSLQSSLKSHLLWVTLYLNRWKT